MLIVKLIFLSKVYPEVVEYRQGFIKSVEVL